MAEAVEQNIIKTDNGRYKARYKDAEGKRHHKTHDRLADARRWLKEKNAQVARNEWTDPELARRTFAQAVEQWRSTWVDLKPTTKARYESLLATHVLPVLGNKPIGRVKRATLQDLIGKLNNNEDVSPATISRIAEVLRGPLAAAVDAGWIPSNPADGLKLPRVPKREMLFLAPRQVRDLADAIPEQYRTAIYLAGYCGLRAGEVWGLRVKDVDLLRRQLHVRQTVVQVSGRPTFDTPKSHEARTVYLPGFLAERLAADIARRGDSGDALVFVTSTGTPMRHSNWARQYFRPAVVGRPAIPRRRGFAGRDAIPPALPEELAGLRFHDLRHTAASIAAASGAQPKEVSRMLGHASIQITMDRYTHLFPDHQEALASRLDAAFREAEDDDDADVVEMGR